MKYPKLPSFRLDGKNALITGAGRGIGMGASIALAESGANVTLVSRTENELKELTEHIKSFGYNATYKVLDVNNENEVFNLVQNSNSFDILINNAGINNNYSINHTIRFTRVYDATGVVRVLINNN